eukprot:scaffold1678_cov110-Isochrysis_galbana.AAC.2
MREATLCEPMRRSMSRTFLKLVGPPLVVLQGLPLRKAARLHIAVPPGCLGSAQHDLLGRQAEAPECFRFIPVGQYTERSSSGLLLQVARTEHAGRAVHRRGRFGRTGAPPQPAAPSSPPHASRIIRRRFNQRQDNGRLKDRLTPDPRRHAEPDCNGSHKHGSIKDNDTKNTDTYKVGCPHFVPAAPQRTDRLQPLEMPRLSLMSDIASGRFAQPCPASHTSPLLGIRLSIRLCANELPCSSSSMPPPPASLLAMRSSKLRMGRGGASAGAGSMPITLRMLLRQPAAALPRPDVSSNDPSVNDDEARAARLRLHACAMAARARLVFRCRRGSGMCGIGLYPLNPSGNSLEGSRRIREVRE